MKIMYDHQIFLAQRYGGISRYFTRMVEEMQSLGEDARIVAPIYRNHYLSNLPGKKMVGINVAGLPTPMVLAERMNRQVSARYAKRFSPSILHETYFDTKTFEARGSARFLTIYDMISELMPDMSGPDGDGSRRKRLAVDRADHVIAISHSTKHDLCDLFDVPEQKVTVVHLGFDQFRSDTLADPTTVTDRPFLLFVGRRFRYKNFDGLLRAVASDKALRETFDIISFGGPPIGSNERRRIEAMGLRPGSVHHMTGGDAVLGGLYVRASAFIYPSKYEGFGLPPLEAMAHDCPVVVSNTSSIPEVVGNAGEYFSPYNFEEQADAIRKVVFDESRGRELRTLGHKRLESFSWTRCASETLDSYRRVLSV